MQHFVPYNKLSKKKKKELDRQKRGSWNGLDPVTRKCANAKIYNRKKITISEDEPFRDFCF